MKYQDEAKKIISLLKDFDKVNFEAWYFKNFLIIGSNSVFQYLEEKEKWNTKCIAKNTDNFDIKISNQTKAILKYLPNIDLEDLKTWFKNSVSIDKKSIIAYIEFKQIQLNNILKPKVRVN